MVLAAGSGDARLQSILQRGCTCRHFWRQATAGVDGGVVLAVVVAWLMLFGGVAFDAGFAVGKVLAWSADSPCLAWE